MTTKITRSNIASTGVAAGSYSAADITVNSSGQVTSASTSSIAASGGGGPKISGVVVTDNAWTAIDDTAVDVLGGYIKITGTGFNTGCLVYFNQTPASSVSFISSTELRVTTGALSAGTYVVYAINTDGGVAIRVPGVTFSASPSWQTGSSLSDQYDGVAITLNLIASDATSYTLVSGSLPPGLSLNASTGAITGTVVGVTVDTTYTFTVRATDAQNQDSPRTFTVTITVSDPHFSKTTLLLSGSAISANTVLRDSSTNNFNLTAYGDARASNFTPYGTGWSVYFDGTGDYLSSTINTIPSGSTPFTVEAWIYPTAFSGTSTIFGGVTNIAEIQFSSGGISYNKAGVAAILSSATTLTLNAWNHIAVVRNGSNNSSILLNGVRLTTTASDSNTFSATTSYIGSGGATQYCFGYLSNLRFVVGTAVYDPTQTTYSIPTSPLTAITNTSLLTCHTNRFLDSSTNNFAITRNGDARVVSFNPFGITNTGVNGSAYFDGTGDTVSIPANTALAMGTGDFTWEFWIYPTVLAQSFIYGYRSGGAGGPQIQFTTTNTYFGSDAANYITVSGTPTLFSWTHIVLVRAGSGTNNTSMYWNGVLKGQATNTLDFNSTGPYYIGSANNTNYFFTGYIADARIIKGTAVYTGAFTPPAQPLTAIGNTQLLTLQYDQPHNNHTFLDSSSNQFLITRSGNATQGSFSPFSPSGWSMFVGGAGYQRWDTNTNYSGTDLTIECWAYATATTTTYTSLISSNLGTGNYYPYFDLGIDGSNLLSCSFYGTSQVVCKNTTSFPLNTWIHCAVVLTSAGAVSLYQAGQRVATASSASIASISTGIQVGGLVQTSGGGYTAYFNGYISNARIVKSAVYSGTTITVPTTALSAIANTNLLVCGENRAVDKANGYALGVNTVSRTAVAFSPFAPTAVYNPAVHGGSAYFDGSGDYLNFTDTANILDMGGVAASVEAWVYPLGNSGNHHIISKSGGDPNWSTTNGIYWIMRIVTGQFGCEYRNGTVVNVITGGTATLNTWHHVAIATDTSNNIALFVNGVRVGTATNAITKPTSRTLIQIADFAGASVAVNAYISGICFKTSTSAYAPTSSTIIIPTAPLTATTNTQLLLNFTDAAILDSTGRNAIETGGDAKVTTIQTKFGTSSQFYNGSNTNLVVPVQPYFSFPGTTSFTVEAWVYFNDLNTQIRPLITLGDGANGSGPIYMAWSIRYMGTEGSNQINWGRYDGTSYDYSTSGLNLVANTWYHIAVSRDSSNTLRIFVNGTSYYSATVTQTFAQINSNPLRIGLSYNGPQTGYGGPRYFNGYIDGIRITQGYARYTANFTPPTGPHRLK